MELNSEDRSSAHDGWKPIGLVGAPGGDGLAVSGSTRVPVGKIRDRQRGGLDQRVARIIEGVPADVRYPSRVETADEPWDDAEPVPRSFFTVLEEQLHAEADAEARETSVEGTAHRGASWRETLRCGPERTDAGQDEHIGLDRGDRIGLEPELDVGVENCLGEGVKVAGSIIEDRDSHRVARR